MYAIRKQVYYDKFTKCYKKILVINIKPSGPLQNFIKVIKPSPPSPFQAEAEMNQCCQSNSCMYAIKYPNKEELYCATKIADFFSFVVSLGYKIDTSLTKLSRQSGDQNIMCIITQ
tara:strand:- start:178 stop:525 length:348 start_codon:yes stop_codon:yes gene_type:complete